MWTAYRPRWRSGKFPPRFFVTHTFEDDFFGCGSCVGADGGHLENNFVCSWLEIDLCGHGACVDCICAAAVHRADDVVRIIINLVEAKMKAVNVPASKSMVESIVRLAQDNDHGPLLSDGELEVRV